MAGVVMLSDMREISRRIELRTHDYIERVKRNIAEEVKLIQEMTISKLKGSDSRIAPFVKIDTTDFRVYIEYIPHVTAMDYHNPGNKKYGMKGNRQPFQEALEELDYHNISPAKGVPIQVAHGEASGIRVIANPGPLAIRRLTK